MPRFDPHHIANHRTRLLACLAAALALLIGAVRFWPVQEAAPELPAIWRASEQERIPIEEIQPTRHAAAALPPPAPLIPVLVPEDEYLAEDELDFSDSVLSFDPFGPPATPSEASDAAPADAASGPRIVRVVTPEYTKEAKRRRVRAKLVVQVLVNVHGRVEEAAVTERFLLDENGEVKESVEVLGHGLEEAALAAANQCMYRPARKNGRAIESRTTITFMLGVDG